MRAEWTAVWALGLAAALQAPATDLRVFLVGNSLTDGIRFDKSLQAIVSNETPHTFNKEYTEFQRGHYAQILAGTPLWAHWYDHTNDFTGKLTTNRWDVLCLQPYTGPLYTNRNDREQGDVVMCSNFIHLARHEGISTNLEVFLYSTWPSIPGYPTNPVFENYDYETNWPAAYGITSAFSDGHRHRPYFEALVAEVRDQWSWDPTVNIRMVPMGDVLFELNRRLRAHPEPGDGTNLYADIEHLYRDGNHLSQGVGAFIGGMVFYTMFYKESPVGLSTGKYNDISIYYFTNNLQIITTNLQALIQQTVWDVVSTHPYAGIAPLDHDRDGLPNAWEKQYFAGPTSAVPGAAAANAAYTVGDAFVAGLDPTDPAAALALSVEMAQDAGAVLRWSPVATDRVYSVWWSSNLLDGFSVLTCGIDLASGVYTDGVAGARPPGHYRITVEMPP
jgi:hypothetical protein